MGIDNGLHVVRQYSAVGQLCQHVRAIEVLNADHHKTEESKRVGTRRNTSEHVGTRQNTSKAAPAHNK